MFIKECITRKKGKKYYSYQLVETIQTKNGPRHRFILSLGKNLPVPKNQFKPLAKRISEILTGKQSLFPKLDENAEKYVESVVGMVLKKESVKKQQEQEKEKIEIYPHQTDVTEVRNIGVEYISHEFFKKLQLDKILKELHFTQRYINLSKALVIARLAQPGSELSTLHYLRYNSALDEILGENWINLNKDVLYRVSDKLVGNKVQIEKKLAEVEKSIFNLEEKIILYDLTSTYFEGEAKLNEKAKYGYSRDKRKDCKQVVVGLVVDEKGFVKRHEVFEGNKSDAKSLDEMINKLELGEKQILLNKPTIVIDKGIATESNIKLLKEKGYGYVAVVRGSKEKENLSLEAGEEMIKLDDEKIRVYRKEKGEEIYLLVESEGRKQKEKSMIDRIERIYMEKMQTLANSVNQGRLKDESKINKKIGYLKAKYPKAAKLFWTKIEKDKDGKICLCYDKVEALSKKVLEGRYVIRTNKKELGNANIISIYKMLTEIENSFRCLKSELGIRPIFHQLDKRARGHIFISILAYHILHAIEEKLKEAKENRSFNSIKKNLQTHVRITVTMTKTDGTKLFMRQNSSPEWWQKEIYKKLELSGNPIGRRYYSIPVAEKRWKPPKN